MDRKEYDQLAEELKPTGHKVKNAWNAFLYGGVLGAIAQGVLVFYMNVYDCSQKEATPMMIITLVFIACLLTGLGLYDNIAKNAGAGTFIPITGFANSMASSALDSKSEGLILGACLLTGLGLYDNIAKNAGAGTFIPITGFANSMASSALDSKSEGLILGIGANMFKLGGTVLTYGIVSAALLGVIRYVFTLFG